MEKVLKLEIRPEWDRIEEVRQQATSFLTTMGLESDNVYSLTMIISELVENGIKYGKFKPPDGHVAIEIRYGRGIITIEVINPVDRTRFGHLRNLDRRIQWIRGYQDSFEAYVERLKEVSRKPFTDEESGLGLARIAYEGKAVLDFYLNENQYVNVSAISRLE